MIIRSYKPEDNAAVQEIVSAVNSGEYGYPDKIREDLAHLEKTYLQGGAFFVAEREGEIVGVLGAQRFGEDIKLRRLHINKRFRRQGVGTKLLEKMMRWAIRNNVHNAYLSTDEQMISSVSFFSKHEFERVKKLPEHIPGDEGDTVFFVKKIKKEKKV